MQIKDLTINEGDLIKITMLDGREYCGYIYETKNPLKRIFSRFGLTIFKKESAKLLGRKFEHGIYPIQEKKIDKIRVLEFNDENND